MRKGGWVFYRLRTVAAGAWGPGVAAWDLGVRHTHAISKTMITAYNKFLKIPFFENSFPMADGPEWVFFTTIFGSALL